MIVRPAGRPQVTSAAIAACLGLTASTPALAQQAVQWRVEDGGNGHWYKRVADAGNWNYAKVRAQSLGGHLATLTSANEASLVASIGGALDWLGASAPAGQGCNAGAWSWVTGESWGFSRWAPGEPGNCGETALAFEVWGGYNGRWNNAFPGSVEQHFICEWSADCDGNGIVDYGEILDGTLEDTNANGVPDCCDAGVSCDPCPGDLNASGTVDAEDLAYILFAWGTDGGKTPQADVNDDGTVNANDLSVVLGSWGPCPN